jgi:cell cycle related kinase
LSDILKEVNHLEDHVPALHIKTWMYMLLCGLEHMHELSIIHRDLKPANLLITQHGLLKIADFGQARLLVSEEGEILPMSHHVATRCVLV